MTSHSTATRALLGILTLLVIAGLSPAWGLNTQPKVPPVRLPHVNAPALVTAADNAQGHGWLTSVTARQLWRQWQQDDEHALRNGQCTDLADRRRPDILQRVMLYEGGRWLLSHPHPGTQPPNVDLSATNWDTLAAQAGEPVGATPRAGAIMVWHSHNEVAWPGHVAYVDSVSAAGNVTITEMHAPVLWQTTTTTLTVADIAVYDEQGENVDYIYRPGLAARR